MPAVKPVAIPDEIPMVATTGLVLTHEPPGAAFARVVVLPWHTVVVPVIAYIGAMVITNVATHPAGVV